MLAVVLFGVVGQARADVVGEEMAGAATAWLNTLNETQRGKATYELKDEERLNWHFIPRARKGLPLKEMTQAQRHLAHALLSTALSSGGMRKAASIMSQEEILREMEKASPNMVRDEELYYVTIFGKPDPKGTWGWRWEGHHLAMNFTIVKGQYIAQSPSMFGTNPAEVREGPRKGLKVLGVEEDLGRQLVQSLNAEQRAVAIYTNVAPADILTAAMKKVSPLKPDGLAASKMDKGQRELLMRIVREYVGRVRPEMAATDLKKIEAAGNGKLFFAWAGSTEPKKGHYYRVQGPTFVLEYDNTQNNANHVHAVWRDFDNDFGSDILKRHYQESH